MAVSLETSAKLKLTDLKNLWHPFTQAKVWLEEENPLIIEKAEGVELIDVEGRRYLDGVSSLWCNVHGHNVPALTEVIQLQAEKLVHSTLLGITHRPILELTERLLGFLPPSLTRVFYADSGSTAVEAGLRMALEWWQNQGSASAKQKTKLASLYGGYHGDTMGAVGVGFSADFHRRLGSSVTQAERIRPPHLIQIEDALEGEQALSASIEEAINFFKRESGNLAAFIIEPIVQGAAGIWIHPPQYLAKIAELCRRHDVLLIADEVATGFGKTGKMFAIEHADVEPDILILGKGLSAGYLPISAAVTSERIFQGFVGEPEEFTTFYYGQTFAGNPLAAAVATKNLELLAEPAFMPRVCERIAHLSAELNQYIRPLSHVLEVRQSGLMVGIELTKLPGKIAPYPVQELAGIRITREARVLGAVIRPLGNVMILMPALAMNEAETTRLVRITAEAIMKSLGEVQC